jgi:hypothetical protein
MRVAVFSPRRRGCDRQITGWKDRLADWQTGKLANWPTPLRENTLEQQSRSQMQNQKETTTKFCRVLVSEANRTRTIWRNQEWCGSLRSPAPYVSC